MPHFQDLDGFSEEDRSGSENFSNQQVCMSMTWHSLIARVKIQDFSAWRFQNFGILPFGFFCHQLNEHNFGLNTGSILSVSSPGYDKLYKKLHGPFYGVGFRCFKVKNCLGYILPTPVLESFEHDFPYLLFQTCTKFQVKYI